MMCNPNYKERLWDFFLKTQQCFLFSLRKMKGNLITKDTVLHFVKICIVTQTACQVELFTVEWVLKTSSKHVRKTEYRAASDYRAICWTHLHLPNSTKSSSLGRGLEHYGKIFPPPTLKPSLWLLFMETIRNVIDQKPSLIKQAHLTWEHKSSQ